MKTNKLLATIAFAFAAAFAARGSTGDIVDIRAVDTDTMKFGERNAGSEELCSSSNPLVSGEDLYIRVRMLVNNHALVPYGAAPKTWYFERGTLGGAQLPKLGLMIGTRPAYAEYSEQGYYAWQRSGELLTDDGGRATTDYRYFTDLYFKYRVQPGDLGLPVKLMNSTGTGAAASSDTDSGYYLLNCSSEGSSHWKLQNEDGTAAKFWYGPGVLEEDWPTGDPTGSGPVRNYDLSSEGVFVKTVDFDSEDVSDDIWRTVYRGMSSPVGIAPSLVVKGGAAGETMTVYVWSADEGVVVPVASGDNTIDTTTGKTVLKVSIPAGSTGVTFKLKGADGAAIGAVTNIYLSPVMSAVTTPAGDLVNVAVSRSVEIVAAPAPTVKMYLNEDKSSASVTADPLYDVHKATLVFKVEPSASGEIVLNLSAKINGSRDLPAAYSENYIRICDSEDYNAAGTNTTVTIPAGASSVTKYIFVLGASTLGDPADTEKGIVFSHSKKSGPSDVEVEDRSCTFKILRGGDENPIVVTAANPAADSVVTMDPGSKQFKIRIADTYRSMNDTTTKYTLFMEDVDDGTNYAEGLDPVKPDARGWLTLTLPVTKALDGRSVVFYALSPDGSTYTEETAYTLKVNDSKQVVVEPQNEGVYVVGEGEAFPLALALNKSFTSSSAKYFFLTGATTADSALFTSAATSTGVSVGPNAPFTAAASATFIDGSSGGTTVTLNGFLANSQTNPGDTDDSYSRGSISVTVTNKPPEFRSLKFGNVELTAADNGKTLDDAVSIGVKYALSLKAGDVKADLTNEQFTVKWVIDGAAPQYTHGDPDGQEITNVFSVARQAAQVSAYIWDKDMDEPTVPAFTFYVTVNEKPSVTITTGAGEGKTFLETDANTENAWAKVELSEAPTETITVRFTVSQTSDGGFLRLNAVNGIAQALDDGGDPIPGAYDITFNAGQRSKQVAIGDMDGTTDTKSGLSLNAAVITDTMNPQGVAWSNYYAVAETKEVYVQNVVPAISTLTFNGVNFRPDAAPVLDPVFVGVPNSFSLTASDVFADLTNGQFSVKWVIDGAAPQYTSGDPSATNVTHTFTGSADRSAPVLVYLKDKDTADYPAIPDCSFTVPLKERPFVVLATGADANGGIFYENEANATNAYIDVTLSEAASDTVWVRVAITPTASSGSLKLRLAASSVEEVSPGVYDVAFAAGQKYRHITINDFDGTADSFGGLDVNASVVTGDGSPYGVAWSNFYNKAETVTVRVQNVEPRVSSVSFNGQYLTAAENGRTLSEAVARGVPKTFSVNVTDVTNDLQVAAESADAFMVKWEIDGVVQYTSGNPAETNVTHTFTSEKEGANVRVWLKDKDMSDYPVEPNYTFRVNVQERPRVEIESYNGQVSFSEDDKSGPDTYLTVRLTESASSDMTVRLTVTPAKTSDGGYLRFRTVEGSVTNVLDGAGDPIENEYDLVFLAGATVKQIRIADMDGTPVTATDGLDLSAKVVTGSLNPDGIAWSDYYLQAEPVNAKVSNVVPTALRPSSYEVSVTNENASANTPYPIYYGCTDIDNDLTNGIRVVITVDGMEVFKTNVTDKEIRSYPVEFSDDGTPVHIVTVTFEDKDGGIGVPAPELEKHDLVFKVQPAKNVQVTAHGPGPTTGTGYSGTYETAPGLGAGRVYAGDKGPSKVQDFTHYYSFGTLASSFFLEATGYKAGEGPDNGNLTPGMDQAIDRNGNWSKDVEITEFYNYSTQYGRAGTEGFDSFVYALLDNTPKGSSERIFAIGEHTRTPISLPESSGDATAYPVQYWEAVFSREFLKSDNSGDINQDGIPDVAVYNYGFGIFEGGHVVKTDGAGDLTDIGDFNDDNDYLPSTETSIYGSLIPGLSGTWVAEGRDFTAKVEIRGYHDGLNGSLSQYGIKSDRIYAEEVDDGTGSMVWQWTENCTISEAEWYAWTEYAAANGLDPNDSGNWKKWSPERPTDPTKNDTDNDGFDDGYEYFFWYRAYVGWLEADSKGNMTHKRLTGRRYDSKNPGEGRLITPEEIVALMDPQVSFGDGATTRDTDNDGLPDLLEFMVGTNPFDFDTDGDGLPDGFETIISGTDPLLLYTTTGVSDAMRNYDGDAMAITSYNLETGLAARRVVPNHPENCQYLTFAVESDDGDSYGVQWYAMPRAKLDMNLNCEYLKVETNTVPMYSFKLADGTKLVADSNPSLTDDGRLAAAMDVGSVYQVSDSDAGPIRAWPMRLEVGTPVKSDSIATDPVDVNVVEISETVARTNVCAAWIYGKGSGNASRGVVARSAAEFGCLALGRAKAVPKNAKLVAFLSEERDVALLHYQVYQQCGFDPRTAWSPNTPLVARWGRLINDEVVENETTSIVGISVRTREYTLYDEFLVMSFFLNNGTEMDVEPTSSRPLSVIWGEYTTNGRGPGEEVDSQQSDNGADTDGDGVPDGWELYVMAGTGGEMTGLHCAPPYGSYSGMAKSYLSPFVPSAKSNNSIIMSADQQNEFQSFEGTDTIAYYAAYSTTIAHEGEWKWFNKFFPTDPWSTDTDGDGIVDYKESSSFAYGMIGDDGKMQCIPGGGLNPCSVDTDGDGLPDPWEVQFKGGKVYADDPKQGYIDGMDGTVQDAVTVGTDSIVNRDYDRDGLENWQEYLSGLMRCWRYDDPCTPWQPYSKELYGIRDDSGGIANIDDEVFAYISATYGDNLVGSKEAFWNFTMNWVAEGAQQLFNPYLVFGAPQGSQYFVHISNMWDPAYNGGAGFYWFYDRFAGGKIGRCWPFVGMIPEGYEFEEFAVEPLKYACCSPISADTDRDGMDDYYELFHGMNPLLGMSGMLETSGGPYDVIYDAYVGTSQKVGYEAWGSKGWNAEMGMEQDMRNYWQRKFEDKARGNKYDFTVFPWMNGVADADPDGDGVPNQLEAIMPKVNMPAAHTDPTPLWMTDSSYSNSLVTLFFRLPTRAMAVMPQLKDADGNFVDYFTIYELGNPHKYYFYDYCDYLPSEAKENVPGRFKTFMPDYWKFATPGAWNAIVSYEENEGYDSDHDGISDFTEAQGKFRAATDPLYAGSPQRRQAMYFQGPGRPSALQTMPEFSEGHPVNHRIYPDDMTFAQYTVECWVMPESVEDSVIVERSVWVGTESPVDVEYMRRNFQLAIKDGKWFTMFDPNGTRDAEPVTAISEHDVQAGVWTHLAATYDGAELVLYVNGLSVASTRSSLQPSYDATIVAVNGLSASDLEHSGTYNHDLSCYLRATIIGASAKKDVPNGNALNVCNGLGWSRYTEFFKGWIDEVRVWDGARTAVEIADAMATAFTAEMAASNRSEIAALWFAGRTRYAMDEAGNAYSIPAELRYHWSFDSVFGAPNETAIAIAPEGFDGSRAKLSRPVGYEIPWLKTILKGYGSTVYSHPAWVTWIPNTVAHLPRFDGTTLDSVYWSIDRQGDVADTNSYANTAEPLSYWSQCTRNGLTRAIDFRTMSSRYFTIGAASNYSLADSDVKAFEFTGRHSNQVGDDLLPLGGAYAKTTGNGVGFWDGNGTTDLWEISGSDGDGDGLPDWWEQYADENYRPSGMDPSEEITWTTIVERKGVRMTAGEAYLQDLLEGAYMSESGEVVIAADKYDRSDADDDKNGIPDWWETMYGVVGQDIFDDPDNDGLSNYAEYQARVLHGVELNPTKAASDGIALDYFRQIEKDGDAMKGWYVGEAVADHDFMEDWWEDKFDAAYVSRHEYDAPSDPDRDGWSNFAETRAGSDPAAASAQAVSEQGLDAYPTPVVEADVSLDTGAAVNGTIVFQAWSSLTLQGSPDAVWRVSTNQAASCARFCLGKPTSGHLREGKNTFVAFLDSDANGRATAGEPMGVLRDVDVGWSRVTDLAFELIADAPEGPAVSHYESGSPELVRIVRTAINGNKDASRIVFSRRIDFTGRPYLSRADYVRTGTFDLDWRYLDEDAKKVGIDPAAIVSADYSVFFGDGSISEAGRASASFSRSFDMARVAPVAVSPSASSGYRLLKARPDFVWSGASGYTAFAIEVATNASPDGVVWSSGTNSLPAHGALGYEFSPELYVGRELLDGTNYFWRVAQFSAKYCSTAKLADHDIVWSEWAEFRTAVDSSNLDTGYGRAKVDVRYYGPATNEPITNVYVEVFKSPDFTGTPLAAVRIGDTLGEDKVTGDLAVTNFTSAFLSVSTNNAVVLDGIPEGTVYVRAFVDRNGNGRRDVWETWGYANGVGTDRAALYAPAGQTVSAKTTKAAECVVFMEDTDVNRNGKPDSLEDVSSLAAAASQASGEDMTDLDLDGLTASDEDLYGTEPNNRDTDGDGMPDGWEIVFADTDPQTADGDYVVSGDVMAYAVTNLTVVKFWDGADEVSASNRYAVMDVSAKVSEGDDASTFSDVRLIYDYGGKYGLGKKTDGSALAGMTVYSVERNAEVVLVHAQVYDAFGFSPDIANPVAYANGEAVNTKAFTALDKYLVCRWLDKVYGLADETAMNTNRDWAAYTLKPGDPDNNMDGVPDGWELYVMFGTNTAVTSTNDMKVSPWKDAAYVRDSANTPDGGGLAIIKEYDQGRGPTDPWNIDSDGDGIEDIDSYKYRIKWDVGLDDEDGDGLSNIAEYLASKSGLLAEGLDPENPMTDGKTPDYWRTVTKDGKRRYIGELYTDHDFMGMDWESAYDIDYVNGYVWDAASDGDGDGWSNFAEARVLTDPTLEAKLSLVSIGANEDQRLPEYPIPTVRMKVSYNGEDDAFNGKIVVKAWHGSSLSGMPDASWTVSGPDSPSLACSRFLGLNPNRTVRLNLGPGMIAEQHCALSFFDPHCTHYHYNDKGVDSIDYYTIDSSHWHGCDSVYWSDNPTVQVNGPTSAAFGHGYVDYRTGDVEIDFTKFQDSWFGISVGSDEVAYLDLRRSFVRVSWMSRVVTKGNTKEFHLSMPDEDASTLGFLREGKNTFVAFADANGNGVCDAGEPYGFVRDVDVGWDEVPEVSIMLTDDNGGTRFSVNGSGQQRIRVVRTAINGETMRQQRTVWSRMVDLDVRNWFAEADFLRSDAFDFDWRYLCEDAAKLALAPDDIKSATYAVMVSGSSGAATVFTRTFDAERAKPIVVSPSESAVNDVYAACPTFVWTGSDDMTAFRLQIATDSDFANMVWDSGTNYLSVSGNRSWKAPVYVGEQLKDGTEYFWRVAEMNAKYQTPDGFWSDPAKFRTMVNHRGLDITGSTGMPLETGYSGLGLEVRYFGPSEVAASNVVVGVYENADFTGLPVARMRLSGDLGTVQSLTNDTGKSFYDVSTNASFYGIAPGSYYAMAFIDLNTNGVRDAYEPWGYVNGRDATGDNIHPVAMLVESGAVRLPSTILVMEDTDLNGNDTPDCIEDLAIFLPAGDSGSGSSDPVSPGSLLDLDGDGLLGGFEDEFGTDAAVWDTDGDGMPDGWEVAFADTDPLTADGDYAAPGDVMAYAVTNLTVITVWDGANVASATNRYAVMDARAKILPGDDANMAGLRSIYDYGGKNGLGMAATAAELAGKRVYNVEENAEVVLVHAQVYEFFGFDQETANPMFMEQSGVSYHYDYDRGFYVVTNYIYGANTKAFTALDKYLVARWLENAYGLVDETDMNTNRDWAAYTLKPGDIDGNRDGIPDGWQLYVMFEADGSGVASSTPWTSPGDARAETSPGGLKWIEEYDGGYMPTDPWSEFTLALDGLSDKVAHDYHLKTVEDQLDDEDHDGLSNWAEFLASKLTGKTFKVDDPCSVTANRLDYFYQHEQDGVMKYIGECIDADGYGLVADHDFMEDWWEDEFGIDVVSRYSYDAHLDPDGDGWTSWSEARALTAPDRSATLSLVKADGSEDHTLAAHPVPTIRARVSYSSGETFDSSVVVKAWRGTSVVGPADATWTVRGSGEASAWNSRFLGLAPNRKMKFNIGPGDISQNHVMLEFYDPEYYIETITYETNGTIKSTVYTLHNVDSSDWGMFYYSDTPADDSNGRNTGALPGGWVNYVNGDIEVDFSHATYRQTDATFVEASGSDKRVVYHYDLTRAFWRVRWMGRLVEDGSVKSFSLSEAADGYLREGKNTFVAFADLNGNGELDAGEPSGFVRGVNVGWDVVTDLDIELRSDENGTRFFVPAQAGGETRIRVVRTSVNGIETRPRMVYSKTLDLSNGRVFTEAELVKVGEWDFDWKRLVPDAAALAGVAADEIRSVGYTVYSGTYACTTFVRNFDATPSAPTPSGACASSGYTVASAQPELSWRADPGYPAFALQIARDEAFSDIVYATTNMMPFSTAEGCRFKPDVYVGEALDDGATYYWRVAQMNSKFIANTWSETASFRTAVNVSNIDTGYGRISAEVRYFGPADAVLSNVVVGVYASADFASAPVARRRLDGDAKASSLTNDLSRAFAEISTNVCFDGIRPGSYYVMAFIDSNANGVREAYESWGYVCNIGTAALDKWAPVPVMAVSGKVDPPSVLVVMEDTDVNGNWTPDCREDMTGWGSSSDVDFDSGIDSDGDGLSDLEEDDYGTEAANWDTDGDGMPDGWEALFADTDPLTADADDVVPGDVMAYVATNLTVITVWDGVDEQSVTNRYALMDANVGVNVGDDASGLAASLVRTYDYAGKYGLGMAAAPAELTGLKVYAVDRDAAVVLVHAQVYEAFGFNPLTANPVEFAAGTAVNTKEFTAFDKYLVCRWLEQVYGRADEVSMNTNREWSACTLKPGDEDGNRDGIPDGWQLYVMFGADGSVMASSTPWTDPENARAETSPGGLKWIEEYDGGNTPTDPWKIDTDGDGIDDKVAYAYLLKTPGSQMADADGDGLSNYTEYLLSEVFKFDVKFSPTNAFSAKQTTPDYFYRVGSIYIGEIFTDHDMVEDVWEDRYTVLTDGFTPGASRYAYDPSADPDGDGWSNFSEHRAGTDPTIAAALSLVSSATGDDNVLPMHPEPIVRLSVIYRSKSAASSGLVLKAWRGSTPDGVPDAAWKVSGSESATTENTLFMGYNPNRVVNMTIGPGSVAQGSFKLEFFDPTYVTTHTLFDSNHNVVAVNNVFHGVDSSHWMSPLGFVDTPPDDATSSVGTFPGGTLNYMTGEVTVDFTQWQDPDYTTGSVTAEEAISNHYKLNKSYVRLSWKSRPVGSGQERRMTLSIPDAEARSLGGLCEGLNTFVAFADLDGDGEYDPATEPYGVARNVDVGWNGANVEIELTDASPITQRFDLFNAGTMKVNSAAETIDAEDLPEDEPVRIRVVRWKIDDDPISDLQIDEYKVAARVILDKIVTSDGTRTITEAEFLDDETFDLDWGSFYDEVVTNDVIMTFDSPVVKAEYLVLLGYSPYTSWDNVLQTNRWLWASKQVITRYYGTNQVRAVAVPTDSVSPSEIGIGVVNTASPTFTWKIDCPEREGYTAFRIQVTNETGFVYDSGIRRAPPRDDNGVYRWTAPLYVDDKTLDGMVFSNKNVYGWRVAMYNSKFRNDMFSTNAVQFRMNVDTNGSSCGTAPVRVRYFGPFKSYDGKVVRVQAFRSPDFAGDPVAAGYVTDNTGLATTGPAISRANCRVVGLPKGTYYMMAFIDTNNNGVRDAWESFGYFTKGYGVSSGTLDPAAITIGPDFGVSDLVTIYVEDADTDGDGLPDAWEYAQYGALDVKGVELLSETPAGEKLINTAFSTLELRAGAGAQSSGLATHTLSVMRNAGTLALATGANTSGYDTFAAAISGSVSEKLVEDGVKITSLELVDGKVYITVETETEGGDNPFVVPQPLQVTCRVFRTESLAGPDWQCVKTETITVDGNAKEIKIDPPAIDAASGFYKVEVSESTNP